MYTFSVKRATLLERTRWDFSLVVGSFVIPFANTETKCGQMPPPHLFLIDAQEVRRCFRLAVSASRGGCVSSYLLSSPRPRLRLRALPTPQCAHLPLYDLGPFLRHEGLTSRVPDGQKMRKDFPCCTRRDADYFCLPASPFSPLHLRRLDPRGTSTCRKRAARRGRRCA